MPINPPQPSITLKGADGKLITAAGTTTKTARANLSGKLQRISDMPVEILTTVCPCPMSIS